MKSRNCRLLFDRRMAPSKPTRLAARRSLGTSLAHLTVADTPPPLRRSPRTSLTDADDEGEHPVPPTLAPRAAKHRARPPPKYNHTLKDNDHDDHAFAFSTHPPTPATAKRASKRSKPVAPQSDSEDETSPRTPAKISKRAAALPVSHDPTTDGLVGINTSETPVGMRNIALRNGPPASGGGGSARRSSHGADHRAKRGSSIGGGFIAVPHPDVDDSKLYRSTDPTAPPALRLRSLLSWTAQRQRDALFPATPSGGATSDAAPTETRTSRSGKGAPQLTEVQKRFAKGVIEDFIEGICDRSIDVSWDATDVCPPSPFPIVGRGLTGYIADDCKREREKGGSPPSPSPKCPQHSKDGRALWDLRRVRPPPLPRAIR